jgi:hypothetical protein
MSLASDVVSIFLTVFIDLLLGKPGSTKISGEEGVESRGACALAEASETSPGQVTSYA